MTLSPWRTLQNVIRTQKCEPCQLNIPTTPFPAGAAYITALCILSLWRRDNDMVVFTTDTITTRLLAWRRITTTDECSNYARITHSCDDSTVGTITNIWELGFPYIYISIIKKILFLGVSAQKKIRFWICLVILWIQCLNSGFFLTESWHWLFQIWHQIQTEVLQGTLVLMRAYLPGKMHSWRPSRNMFDPCRTLHKFDCSFCSWSACTEVPGCTSAHKALHLESHRSACKVMFARETLFCSVRHNTVYTRWPECW